MLFRLTIHKIYNIIDDITTIFILYINIKKFSSNIYLAIFTFNLLLYIIDISVLLGKHDNLTWLSLKSLLKIRNQSYFMFNHSKIDFAIFW